MENIPLQHWNFLKYAGTSAFDEPLDKDTVLKKSFNPL